MTEIAHDVDADAIADRLGEVEDRIEKACQRAGRSREEVRLIGVTKTFPLEAVEAAREAGLKRFGENKVQELIEKAEKLPGRLHGGDIEWYMIGHLQRNKAKDVVEHADFFQALDSPRLAKELNKRAGRANRTISCLVQINVSDEESKYGFDPDAAHQFLDSASNYEHLTMAGLMTIASFVEDAEAVRPEFRRLRELFESYDAAASPNVEMTHLSMGMSNDFEVAIEEGATDVRIGSAIFGARNY